MFEKLRRCTLYRDQICQVGLLCSNKNLILSEIYSLSVPVDVTSRNNINCKTTKKFTKYVFLGHFFSFMISRDICSQNFRYVTQNKKKRISLSLHLISASRLKGYPLIQRHTHTHTFKITYTLSRTHTYTHTNTFTLIFTLTHTLTYTH